MKNKKTLSGLLAAVMSSCLIAGCVITCAPSAGISDTVYAASDNSVISPDSISESDTNIEYQNYRWGTWDYFNDYANTIGSYIVNTDNNCLMTFQPGTDGKYIASYYSSDYKLVKTRTIEKELDIFGGFYSGSDGYYIITGQDNPDESDSVECFRITKYDKNWNRISSDGLDNCNTKSPFHAGSLRVAEYGNYLIIRTCHLMYKSENEGLNHQANVTIEYNKSSGKITDSFTGVMNKSYGYVSHSFNQFVQIENGKIVAVDHGDAYPRSIVLIKYNTDMTSGKFVPNYYSPCTSVDAISFAGNIGDNSTGSTVGGFEISGSSYLIAGSSEDNPGSNPLLMQRNIFVTTVSKKNNSVKTNYLTNDSSGTTTSNTPQLVKINNNKFVLIWTTMPYKRYEMTFTGEINYAILDGNGNITGEIHKASGYISDCHPIVIDGKAVWYVYNNSRMIFYTLDPDTLEVKQNAIVDPTGITLSKTAVTINKGGKSTITATISPAVATDKTVTWTSSDRSIATVSNGTITAQSTGKAIITAKTFNGKTATCTVTVVIKPTKISLSKTSLSIQKGRNAALTATVYPTDSTDKTVTWTTSNSKVATVSDGKVTAVAAGKATITAKTSNGKTASCSVTVTNPPVEVTGISLNKTAFSIGKGEIADLIPAISPSNATDKTLTWTSDNSSVVTVSSSGEIVGKNNGSAVITAKTGNGKTAKCTVNVKNAPDKVSISKGSVTIGVGEKFSVTSSLPDGSAAESRIYRTSNSSIVKMTRTYWQGDFVGVKPGVAYVTVRTYNGRESTCKVTVKNAPDKITISKGTVTIGVGESYTVGSGVNDGAGCATRTYRTSNSSVAKMTRTDWNGVFVGVKPGVAYITVRTYNGKESTCKVTVKKAPQSVNLSKSVMTLKVGQTGSLSAIIASDAGCATRTFRTSNSSVVKMTKTNWTGEFKAVKKGVAYVTVRTYNGLEKSCKITVV